MTKFEALALASQLGLTVKSAADLEMQVHAMGHLLGLEHDTGDWVVWAQDGRELARCA